MQYVSVAAHSIDPGYMDVVCYFANGSQAKGCKISAILIQDNKTCEYTVARGSEGSVSMAIALPEGEYILFVYDVEVVSPTEPQRPAFTTVITVENSSATGILDIAYDSRFKIQ